MKITAVKPFPLNIGGRRQVYVKVYTDEGISGLGEAGLWPGEMPVVEAIRAAERALVGEDPSRLDHLWQKLFRGSFWRGGPVYGAAISAIDIALWDLQGKALGVPVYKLLGGKSRDKVLTYGHLGDVDHDTLVRRAKEMVAAGWKAIRFAVLENVPSRILEPGLAVRQCVKNMAAVREAVGDDIDICIDFHLRLSPAYAVELGRALEPFRPYFIEDPIRFENPASYRQVRDHVHVPIATGEHLTGKWAFAGLIENDLINYARPDLCVFGGLTEARKLAGWCEAHYIDMAPHNPLGPVSSAACVHLCTAVPNFGVLECTWRPGEHAYNPYDRQGQAYQRMLSEVISGGPGWEDGYYVASEAPGLGVELNEEAAARYPYEPSDLILLWRKDGSLTDW